MGDLHATTSVCKSLRFALVRCICVYQGSVLVVPSQMLELVRADCEQMLSSVSSTASLAEHISSKVRRLDTVQARVSAVTAKIDLVLDRTNCINGVQSAMESEVSYVRI